MGGNLGFALFDLINLLLCFCLGLPLILVKFYFGLLYCVYTLIGWSWWVSLIFAIDSPNFMVGCNVLSFS